MDRLRKDEREGKPNNIHVLYNNIATHACGRTTSVAGTNDAY